MTDQPERQTEQIAANSGGTDLWSIVNNGTRPEPPQPPQRQQDVTRPGAQSGDVQIGTDASNTVVIRNQTLELSYKDANFENKIEYAAQHGADRFNKIKIDDLPSNFVVHTWIDKTGYFLWYDKGDNGPKERHYLPNNAFSLEVNNAKIDLESERIKDNQLFAKEHLGSFRNFDRSYVPSYDGTTNSTSYYWKLAGGSTENLAIQEHALRESVRHITQPLLQNLSLRH